MSSKFDPNAKHGNEPPPLKGWEIDFQKQTQSSRTSPAFPGIANSVDQPHNQTMNSTITPELLDAKLDALMSRFERDNALREEVRARREADLERDRAERSKANEVKLAEIHAENMRAEAKRVQQEEARLAKMDETIARLDRDMGKTAAAVDESIKTIQESAKSLKFWMIGTGLTVVLGVAAFNATVLSNMVASFESGKNTTATVLQAQQRMDNMDKNIDEIKSLLKQQATLSASGVTER